MAALSLAQMLHVFQAAVVAVLFPRASGRTLEEVTALAGFAMRATTAVTLFAAIGLAVLGPWVLGLLYGQEYLGAVRVFRILLLYIVLYGATAVLAQALMALNRPGTVAILHALGLGLALPLLLVLVPRYGLVGAGLALLISTAVRFVAVIISFPLLLKVPIPRFRPTHSDLAAIIRMFH